MTNLARKRGRNEEIEEMRSKRQIRGKKFFPPELKDTSECHEKRWGAV